MTIRSASTPSGSGLSSKKSLNILHELEIPQHSIGEPL
jgi:hypothetical protein